MCMRVNIHVCLHDDVFRYSYMALNVYLYVFMLIFRVEIYVHNSLQQFRHMYMTLCNSAQIYVHDSATVVCCRHCNTTELHHCCRCNGLLQTLQHCRVTPLLQTQQSSVADATVVCCRRCNTVELSHCCRRNSLLQTLPHR